jgi:Ser/Thr protein kinase RdoA (MazF antagonist)
VERYVNDALAVLVDGGVMQSALAPRYRDVARRIADAVGPPLAAARAQRIHGDLHWGNVLWGGDGPILVDFDDMLVGPPVQDLWLLARGLPEEARKARDQIIEGYELFREFDRASLALCEPLRALRIIYVSGWIARRWDDQSFRAAFPTFNTDNYWAAEYEALYNIYEGL